MAGRFFSTYWAAKSTQNHIDGLLLGTRWTSPSITYSFPDSLADYQAGYGNIDMDRDGIPLSREALFYLRADQQNTVHFALESTYGGAYSVEGFTNLGISFDGFGSGLGTIRVISTADTSPAQVADFPGGLSIGEAYGGDVFLGNELLEEVFTPGTYNYSTTIHELGHALGLKHPHENQGDLPGAYKWYLSQHYNITLDSKYDGLEYTVMSYKGASG